MTRSDTHTIIVDIEAPHARVGAAVLWMLSGGGIGWRLTWLVRPGESVWSTKAIVDRCGWCKKDRTGPTRCRCWDGGEYA